MAKFFLAVGSHMERQNLIALATDGREQERYQTVQLGQGSFEKSCVEHGQSEDGSLKFDNQSEVAYVDVAQPSSAPAPENKIVRQLMKEKRKKQKQDQLKKNSLLSEDDQLDSGSVASDSIVSLKQSEASSQRKMGINDTFVRESVMNMSMHKQQVKFLQAHGIKYKKTESVRDNEILGLRKSRVVSVRLSEERQLFSQFQMYILHIIGCSQY
ncbi:hypothetical protein FGO68_gene16610 [Halteria grandinella]|uniref:Uncharacterized protein n=1 Tax=Halteria grandinella TaxID=5974 RepID=A0A8J8NRA4_HALGN|nr:hypothetical protein FGO68_gene16610 [Halteria grandinella]